MLLKDMLSGREYGCLIGRKPSRRMGIHNYTSSLVPPCIYILNSFRAHSCTFLKLILLITIMGATYGCPKIQKLALVGLLSTRLRALCSVLLHLFCMWLYLKGLLFWFGFVWCFERGGFDTKMLKEDVQEDRGEDSMGKQ